MNKLARIHDLRCALALKRQPEHDADLKKLLQVVPPAEHPYREGGGSESYGRLIELPEFCWPSKGRQADLGECSFLYHLRPLGGFISRLAIRFQPGKPLPPNGDPTINFANVRQILDECMAKGAWTPLSAVASGLYETRERGFKARWITWWTDLEITQEGVMDQIRKLGIPDNWLYEDCVLLRCEVDDELRAKALVPSALDGFASEVFIPAESARSPRAGMAIDISKSPFGYGRPEFVLGPVEVNKISFTSISIPRTVATASRVDSADPKFLTELERFYHVELS